MAGNNAAVFEANLLLAGQKVNAATIEQAMAQARLIRTQITALQERFYIWLIDAFLMRQQYKPYSPKYLKQKFSQKGRARYGERQDFIRSKDLTYSKIMESVKLPNIPVEIRRGSAGFAFWRRTTMLTNGIASRSPNRDLGEPKVTIRGNTMSGEQVVIGFTKSGSTFAYRANTGKRISLREATLVNFEVRVSYFSKVGSRGPRAVYNRVTAGMSQLERIKTLANEMGKGGRYASPARPLIHRGLIEYTNNVIAKEFRRLTSG